MPYSLNGAQVQAVGGRWRRHSPLVSHPSRSSSRTALALWKGVLSSTTTTGFLGLPRRAPPLYNLASSNRSGSESAGVNIRNLKGVFAEWESDGDERSGADPAFETLRRRYAAGEDLSGGVRG